MLSLFRPILAKLVGADVVKVFDVDKRVLVVSLVCYSPRIDFVLRLLRAMVVDFVRSLASVLIRVLL